MASNFSGQIAQLCHKNDVQSSGHFLLEEYLACHVVSYGNFMKVMRNFDIPSCDLPIARPGNVDWKFWMPKFLSSAAYLDNKSGMVAALIDPIIGYGLNELSPRSDERSVGTACVSTCSSRGSSQTQKKNRSSKNC